MAARFSYVEAEKLYQKFLSEQPQNSMGHHMYGRMLALQTRYEDALKQYKLSLKLKPNDASVMNDVGVTLSISGFQPLGARFLKQSSLVDSNYPAALNNLGVVLMSLDAYKQASDSFAKSLLIQARNIKIRELKVKADAKVADSKDFDYGLPVSWQDIPDSLKKVEPVIEQPETKDPGIKTARKPARPEDPKPMDETDKKWLEKTQPLFLELKTSGFANIGLSGNGMVQVADTSDSADNIGNIDLSSHPRIELMGDVTIDLTGSGEIELGKGKVIAKSDECIFSLNAESGEVSCYAGEFVLTNCNSVTATRTSTQVDVKAHNCQSVYAQDDSKIDASNCEEVTLVGHAQGLVYKCKKLIVNDNSRAIARDCEELTAMANARVKASGCGKVEALDHAKIENSD